MWIIYRVRSLDGKIISIFQEALSFGKENDFGTTDICEIARRMCLLPKVNSNKSRVVVITQVSPPLHAHWSKYWRKLNSHASKWRYDDIFAGLKRGFRFYQENLFVFFSSCLLKFISWVTVEIVIKIFWDIDSGQKRQIFLTFCTPAIFVLTKQKIWNLKGSPDPSHFIFEINVGKRRIRHRTILYLNYAICNRFWVDLEIQFQGLFNVGSAFFSTLTSKIKWLGSELPLKEFLTFTRNPFEQLNNGLIFVSSCLLKQFYFSNVNIILRVLSQL